MKIISSTKRVLRGDVNAKTAVLEAMRRFRTMNTRRKEQAELAELERRPARLREEFARLKAADLLAHFHSRPRPTFFPGLQDADRVAPLQAQMFPDETARLIKQAGRIAGEHCWPLLGIGEQCFGADEIQWHRDPLSGFVWPLDYHARINLVRNDGSDARVLWELNRCAHFITLGRAYAVTHDDQFSEAFFQQMRSWRRQNPLARGVNWNCAMEVALRAMNLLAAFTLFLRAPQMDAVSLQELLQFFDQHGAHIQRHLEFSHIATSNHYLADITGLLWMGLMLPELAAAAEWREFAAAALLNEMDKQVLSDGADYEASTGYHRLKLELWLYSFVLCHLNGLEIDEKYWRKLRAMLCYVRAYLRPDGRAPLIGDSDSGQVLPIVARAGDDHGYVLALGATVFHEPRFRPAGLNPPEELVWLLGETGLNDYQALPASVEVESQAFPAAGTYFLRADDLYLAFNAGGVGVNGRGSHGHNDALSVEVSAGGTAFIVDPGSYLYTADLHERHLFRSTAYHSTAQVDGVEQNRIDEAVPFVIGNEARPRVLSWDDDPHPVSVVAEHYGYQKLATPVTHRRTVRFFKSRGYWSITDEMIGEGTHEFCFRFQLAPGLKARVRDDGIVEVCDEVKGSRLLISRGQADHREQLEDKGPGLEPRFSSNHYGQKNSSIAVCWTIRTSAPLKLEFLIVPLGAGEDENERLTTAGRT